jgi:hypothetical protein
MSSTERDAWELANLVGWLATRAPEDLMLELVTLERARNELNRVIGIARKALPDAA